MKTNPEMTLIRKERESRMMRIVHHEESMTSKMTTRKKTKTKSTTNRRLSTKKVKSLKAEKSVKLTRMCLKTL